MGMENMLPDCHIKLNIRCSFLQTTLFVKIKFFMFVLNFIPPPTLFFFFKWVLVVIILKAFSMPYFHIANFLGTRNF